MPERQTTPPLGRCATVLPDDGDHRPGDTAESSNFATDGRYGANNDALNGERRNDTLAEITQAGFTAC